MTEIIVATPEEPPTPALFDILPMADDIRTLPKPEQPYYLVGRDKRYIFKRTRFGDALVQINNFPNLPNMTTPDKEQKEIDAFLWTRIEKLPAGLIGQIWSFFRAIWLQDKTEAMVYLTYKDGVYRVFVPEQDCTSGHVRSIHNPEHIQDGWARVGDFHSHCNFSANHSTVDDRDAAKNDGLHITVGYVNLGKPDYDVMISANGHQWMLDLKDITDQDPNLVDHPKWWEDHVNKIKIEAPKTTYTSTTYGYSQYNDWQDHKNPTGSTTKYIGADKYSSDGLVELTGLLLKQDKIIETDLDMITAAELEDEIRMIEDLLIGAGIKLRWEVEFSQSALDAITALLPEQFKNNKPKKAKTPKSKAKEQLALLPGPGEIKNSLADEEETFTEAHVTTNKADTWQIKDLQDRLQRSQTNGGTLTPTEEQILRELLSGD